MSEKRSIFALVLTWDCQLIARIDGIDGNFLFGNLQSPQPATGVQHPPSCLGVFQVSRARALVHTNCFIMYLGLVTHFGSPGTSLGTLAS